MEFSYLDMHLAVDTDDKEKLIFSHRQYPGCGIYTYDQNILKHPSLRLRGNLKKQIEEANFAREGVSKHALLVYAVLALIAMAVLILWVGNNAILAYIVSRIPPSVEEDIGKSVLADIKKEEQFLSDPEYLTYLSAVGKRLNAAMPKGTREFKYFVLDEEMVNAFAVPGGYILVCRGLIEQVQTPEELAGVLAHECAHLTEKHSMRKIAGTLGPGFVMHYFLGARNSLLTSLTATAAYIGQQSYSRKQESEADEIGFDYLVKAQINPEGMIVFFKRMQAQELGFSNPTFLSSHPPTGERMDKMEQKLEALGRKKYKPFPPIKKPTGVGQ